MNFSDKIISLRKKNGWSQEELAERLGVTRQSVSKWESAQSQPDLSKIIQMSELFSVTTDYLLKDGVQDSAAINEEKPSFRTVDAAHAKEYLALRKSAAPKTALATAMCTTVVMIYTYSPYGNGQIKYSWTIWAVAGVLYGAFALIIDAVEKSKENR